ncbi:MAG: restriction endonuclease [Gammaproteobacteria bacterium]|nr:restriction endonuclease [Gammaproteobacteria bacterium]
MTEPFFANPILNSPYERPSRHWELDEDRRPTGVIVEDRRRSKHITAVPKHVGEDPQAGLEIGVAELSTAEQQYDPMPVINDIRGHVDAWRQLPAERSGVTPVTARLLRHWREWDKHRFGQRPFFCQIEAVETAIWLTEVADCVGGRGRAPYRHIRDHLHGANENANPDLLRIALKLATGAGKTTVMAMLIAWQTLNAVRQPGSRRFTRGFLIVTPGITIRDRLRVLQPNDPASYYAKHDLVPKDMLPDLGRAMIVITNYHAFLRRESMKLARGSRALLQGHREEIATKETEGEMLRRSCGELLGMKNIVVLNDEAHHCYREKPGDADEETPTGEAKGEAERNTDAARLWVNGLETVQRRLGIRTVFDLSATPFFLAGSGYREGTLFPWTMCDFSLLDAIESGIVKLPRVPVADDVSGDEMPRYRELWKHIGPSMPKKGRASAGRLDPLSLPPDLKGAIDALYSHYKKHFDAWRAEGIEVPPVFIVVCSNTATSKLVYDYIAGFERSDSVIVPGHLPLFRNYDEDGNRAARPQTLLIDSEQLESGEALDRTFRTIAADEIERFRRERTERDGAGKEDAPITDAELLREAMNTVGKPGQLGESIRCVVSVAMLSEGWDANTVTHVLGVRAFGTQLLCEQVVGRGLRRQSYELNAENRFDVEYADVLGIPFDFTAEPVVVPPVKPRRTIHVHAVKPDRDALAIVFPRVEGYTYELREERLSANFTADSTLTLTPELVGPRRTRNEGILGEGVVLTPEQAIATRKATVAFHLAKHLLFKHFRGANEAPKVHLLGDLRSVARQWLDEYLICEGGTTPGQILYTVIADEACDIIHRAIVAPPEPGQEPGKEQVRAVLDPYNPRGSTADVDFTTSKTNRWETDPTKCHVNWAICDSDWEREFCRLAERRSSILAYVKNQGMGFTVPYCTDGVSRQYVPDFIVRVKDGGEEPVNLVVEIKGLRRQDAKDKADTMRSMWVPAVNALGDFGRWAFAEFKDIKTMEDDFHRWMAENAVSPAVRAGHSLILAGGSEPNLEYIPRRRSKIW